MAAFLEFGANRANEIGPVDRYLFFITCWAVTKRLFRPHTLEVIGDNDLSSNLRLQMEED